MAGGAGGAYLTDQEAEIWSVVTGTPQSGGMQAKAGLELKASAWGAGGGEEWYITSWPRRRSSSSELHRLKFKSWFCVQPAMGP